MVTAGVGGGSPPPCHTILLLRASAKLNGRIGGLERIARVRSLLAQRLLSVCLRGAGVEDGRQGWELGGGRGVPSACVESKAGGSIIFLFMWSRLAPELRHQTPALVECWN